MKTIVVGVDSTDRTKYILASALNLAQKTGAKVLPVRAVGLPVQFGSDIVSASPEDIALSVREAAQAEVEKIVADAPKELMLPAEAVLGVPWQAICDVAERSNADLVVVGTHNRNALDYVLGTTAARVVNHAPCAVLVVRHELK